MSKKKKKKTISLGEILETMPEIRAELSKETTQYLGPCIQQSPGAWTRVGPTFRTPHNYITIGPGAAVWGTNSGLAELAMSTAPSPTWHETGVSISPTPNLLFAVARPVLEKYPDIAMLTEQADELVGK